MVFWGRLLSKQISQRLSGLEWGKKQNRQIFKYFKSEITLAVSSILFLPLEINLKANRVACRGPIDGSRLGEH